MVIFDVLLVRDPYQYLPINSKHNTDSITGYQLVSCHTWTLLSSPKVELNRYKVASIETRLIYCNALHYFSACFCSIWCRPWRIHFYCEYFLSFVESEINIKYHKFMKVETIQYWDYPVETHDVVTVDGYVLSMYRIKHGRSASRGIITPNALKTMHLMRHYSVSNITSCNSKRPPILLVHGLGLDSAQFVMNPPESSPGRNHSRIGCLQTSHNIRNNKVNEIFDRNDPCGRWLRCLHDKP